MVSFSNKTTMSIYTFMQKEEKEEEKTRKARQLSRFIGFKCLPSNLSPFFFYKKKKKSYLFIYKRLSRFVHSPKTNFHSLATIKLLDTVIKTVSQALGSWSESMGIGPEPHIHRTDQLCQLDPMMHHRDKTLDIAFEVCPHGSKSIRLIFLTEWIIFVFGIYQR